MIQGYTSSNVHLTEGMKTVDALERLGVGYHFREEIGMFMDLVNGTPARDTDEMASAALRFRLLRQHHYDAPCDVFESFVDKNGGFKDTLRSDVDALLAIYEAAHLSKCDEDLLSNAVVFTTSCLSAMAEGGKLPESLLKKVEHALDSPTQRRFKRVETKLYISIYGKDEDSNQDILELAKLDFHILQQMHRDEASSFSLYFREHNLGSNLGPYIRERPVECYLWALGVFYEPQYAKARMMLAKLINLCSLFDDTIDSYATVEELHLFNKAVQSWDEEAAKKIGDCFGYLMSLLSKTLDEFVADGASPLGIECTKQFYEKDISGVSTAVQCYSKEHGVTIQEAKKALWCIVEDQWRSTNQEFLSTTMIPVPLLTHVINLSRVMETMYKNTSAYTFCKGVEEHIENVLDKCACA
ncbi:hypothetical protein GUJ93_ZPchr0014g46986 [Zizania palustris]|uniref:Uncharacterized protein n=1 Tax=Zizania palustris TaxID=103762 RepID=A0A8J5SWP5_ZIZPA|nr:hypothetical protein GUJ93_ZPchr0014g47256 [Zizania palustris]KAG8082033.1 hypothetical protein GUJ93_ZPchr0014g46986 [Zizania palustris]